MTRIKYWPWRAVMALVVAILIHYLIYAYRFMWYLDYPNFIRLISIYIVFVALILAEFLFFARWWLMGLTGFLVMLMPAAFHVKYLIPIGIPFLLVAGLSAGQFVGVAVLKTRRLDAELVTKSK